MKVRTRLRRLVVVATVLLAASCTSSHPDLTTARNDCTAVGRLSAASPQDRAAWIEEIIRTRRSGIFSLDRAMHDLFQAMHGTSISAADHAFTEVITACARLKLWQDYH